MRRATFGAIFHRLGTRVAGALAGALSAAVLAAAPLAAQAQAPRPMPSVEDGRGWEAVGRINLGRAGFCTGALIAPDLVLTAAHCLYDDKTGARIPAEQMEFLAGWRGGRAAAYRMVRRAIAHPDYVFADDPSAARVRFDLALLELYHPVQGTTVAPFAAGDLPETGGRYGIVSYAHDRSEAPAMQDACALESRQGDVLVLSCPVDFGASGAPVFREGPRGVQIVSVVAAKAMMGAQHVALGSALGAEFSRLMALREAPRSAGQRLPVIGGPAPSAQVTPVSAGRAGGGSAPEDLAPQAPVPAGAKFIQP